MACSLFDTPLEACLTRFVNPVSGLSFPVQLPNLRPGVGVLTDALRLVFGSLRRRGGLAVACPKNTGRSHAFFHGACAPAPTACPGRCMCP